MKHLNEAEFVDLIDGVLGAQRANHAEVCTSCRDRVMALRTARDAALGTERSEPSPLFWDHFASRVSDAIALEPEPVTPPGWAAWLHNPAVTWAAAASLAMLLMVGALWRAVVVAPEDPAAPPVAASQSAPRHPADSIDDLDRVAAWVDQHSDAGDAAWEDAVGIAARPGAAERVVLELSDEERAELARLLERELKRRGA